MKISKKQISNLLFIGLLAVILFTPVGTTIKVWVNRLFAVSPSEVEVVSQQKVSAYNWRLVDDVNSTILFSRSRNRVVLVNFWATWCPPCIAEMPELQLLYSDYKDKVDFYFVTRDDFQKVNSFFKKNKYDLPVFHAVNNLPDEFNVSSIPRTFVLNKKGNIVFDVTGAAAWNSEKFRKQLDALLSEY
ncbi:TlpA family protein disulfide reductase [Zhouia sp. PK063]|uniref:TlpA family protein disulfide reductase n=1 Tax=Zhouia sp. PK063 TaxID=3373602 RepID=UPI00378D67D3